MPTFIVGDVWRTECRFDAVNPDTGVSELTDPTTVTLKVRKPNGDEASYTYEDEQVVRQTEGVYRYDILLTMSGEWSVRWVGTGTVPTAVERTILVAPSRFDDP